MYKSILLIVLTFLVLWCLPVVPLSACSIFSLIDGDTYYMAGNEDWRSQNNSVRFVPAKKGAFGYAVFSVNGFIDTYPQIGLNDRGLCVDWATVPASPYKNKRNRKDLRSPLLFELLRTCRSVDDVINFVNTHNTPHLAEEHLMVADRAGNSVVLEWDEKDVTVIKRKETYQLITNFRLLKPEAGWYPCDRYSRAEKMLKARKTEAVQGYVRDILAAIQMTGDYFTQYSYIFDLTKNHMVIYNARDYTRFAKIRLDDALKKGLHTIDLNDLTYK